MRLEELLEFLDARGVRGRTLAFDGRGAGRDGTSWRCRCGTSTASEALRSGTLATRFGAGSAGRTGLGTVTCVGAGLNADWVPLRRALAAAEALGARVHGLHTSPLQLTPPGGQAHLKALTARLHRELLGLTCISPRDLR